MARRKLNNSPYRPFDCDGRRKILPPDQYRQQFPMSTVVNAGCARRLIEHFLSREQVSSFGTTLWVYLVWCEHNDRQYELITTPHGYMLILKPESPVSLAPEPNPNTLSENT